MLFVCICFFFNDTATTEIYTTDTLFPYTTLFRSQLAAGVHVKDLHAAGALVEDAHLVQDVGGDGWGVVLCRPLLGGVLQKIVDLRSEEHTSELQSLMRISYAVFCLKKNK